MLRAVLFLPKASITKRETLSKSDSFILATGGRSRAASEGG